MVDVAVGWLLMSRLLGKKQVFELWATRCKELEDVL